MPWFTLQQCCLILYQPPMQITSKDAEILEHLSEVQYDFAQDGGTVSVMLS